jgi:hypothetical protein
VTARVSVYEQWTGFASRLEIFDGVALVFRGEIRWHTRRQAERAAKLLRRLFGQMSRMEVVP